jgi:hypothetical protein
MLFFEISVGNVFSQVVDKKTQCDGQKKHEKFKEVFPPFLSCGFFALKIV